MSAKINYGGQAVLEGVVMSGPMGKAISCRRPDGVLIYKTERKNSLKDKYPILKLPVFRGVYSFGSSMASGMRDISWSAMQAGDDEAPMTKKELALAIVLAAILVIGIFIAIPVLVGTWAAEAVGPFGRSALEGLLRILLFLGYVVMISRMEDIRRLFAYHGAEHKTINAYEAGAELKPDTVRAYSRIHTRCGTSFVLMSMLLMIVIFTFVGQTGAISRILIKLAMMPVVAGLAYELFRLPLSFPNSRVVRILTWPGLAMQRLTTAEPDDGMLDAAIHSLTRVPGFVPTFEGVSDYHIHAVREGEKQSPEEEGGIKALPESGVLSGGEDSAANESAQAVLNEIPREAEQDAVKEP